MKSKNYKTSVIYGDKIIVIPEDMEAMFKMYVEQIRPYIMTKGEEDTVCEEGTPSWQQFIFTTKGNSSQMKHKDVSTCMTSSFKKAGSPKSYPKCLVN